MPKVRTTKFRGRQQNLYTLSRKAWGYCQEHISDIQKAKAMYTPAFIADMLQQVDTAEAIPDYYNRKDLPKDDYSKMQAAALAVLEQWQMLKDYITDAFEKNLLKSKLEAAGHAYYRPAATRTWDSVASLINSANTFMKANLAALQANGNMPAGFPTAFEDLGKTFNDLRMAYFGKGDNKDALSKDKADADAEVHQSLMKMLRLANRVFKNKPEIGEKFVYANLLREVRGNQAAGLKGTITAASTKQPIKGAVIRAIGTEYHASSGNNGRFSLAMASGSYNIEVSAPGYQTVVIKRKIEVGIQHRFNLAMETSIVHENAPSTIMLSELLKDVPVTNGAV